MNEISAQDVPIVRFVIGDKNYDFRSGVQRHYTDGPVNQIQEISEYHVELPESFAHGFPDRWNFSIIRIKSEVVDEQLRRQLVNKMKQITDAHPLQKGIPVLFVSTTDAFQVADELPPHRLHIFALQVDDDSLSSGRQTPSIPTYQSPLIASIKKSLTSQQWQEFWLSPYRLSTPANGWRFFGRQKEIRKLTETLDNFVVVGARRIGKTSLLQELARVLQKRGYTVYNVDTQFSKTERDLTNKIVEALDPRMAVSLTRRQEVVTTSMLENTLQHLAGKGNSALLIDEIGNLLAANKNEAWKVMGTIRSYLHKGGIKLVCTASQTYLLKQQQDYSGPWVNFASTLVLRGLTREEVQDFVLTPLKIWHSISKMESEEVFDLVYHNVGSHPLLLTAFCEALFARAVGKQARVINATHELLHGRDEGIVKAIHEVFFAINKSVIQYIFLQHCLERSAANEPLMHSIISERWIGHALEAIGYRTHLATRLFLLEALNTRALTEPHPDRDDQSRLIAPLIYTYSRAHMSLEEKRDSLRDEIVLDADEYELVRIITDKT